MDEDRPLAGMRVLVVEDDYYLASDEQQMLEAAGAAVVGPFGESEEACRAIGSSDIHCALVDINLGDGPNFAVARELREKSIPFLFTTGYDHATIPEDFAAVRCIEKPTSARAIVAALVAMR
jgi:DNA-binding response OmpR family regulator